MQLDAEGLRVRLPPRWEGAITRNPARTSSPAPAGVGTTPAEPSDAAGVPDPAAVEATGGRLAVDGSIEMPVAHVANFALPGALDVFGSQAVPAMAAGDRFVALVEYAPEEAHTALFSRDGLPRRLRPADFSPSTLNRVLPDQVGTQVFATEAGRPLCLYVVVAGRSGLGDAVREVNDVLATLEVRPR